MPELARETIEAAEVTIDLGAVARNYRTIEATVNADGGPTEVAAMVKSDGYGLGAAAVARRLSVEGCGRFFVAVLDEGLSLAAALERTGRRGSSAPEILVLSGPLPSTESMFVDAGLVPVLNSLEQIERWQAEARRRDRVLPAAVHLDTGMHRLGLSGSEWHSLWAEPDRLDGIEWRLVLSHLASADHPQSEQTHEQLLLFRERLGPTRCPKPLGMAAASLANSAAIFAGAEFHFDVVRPGIALYGGSPRPDVVMATVLTARAPVIQVFPLAKGDLVGYGATHRMDGPGRAATVAVGYGDGFLRASSGRGSLHLVVGERSGAPVVHELPLLGRVSMDLVTVDVSAVPEGLIWPGRAVEVLGPHRRIDDAAAAAGTISYELLCDLGRRYRRTYID